MLHGVVFRRKNSSVLNMLRYVVNNPDGDKYGLRRSVGMPAQQWVYLRWLIVCVNWAGPWDTQIFGQTLFWVLLQGCFGWD